MKKIYNIFPIFLLGCIAFLASCGDDDFGSGPSPVIAENNQGAYFDKNNKLKYELEPAEATSVSFNVLRSNSKDAVSVPVKVLVNDSNIFVIPESINFAKDETEATITVNFPDAKVGEAYNLQITFDDPKYEYYNPYTQGNHSLTASVSRVKWNLLGNAMYHEAIFNPPFGTGITKYEVQVEKREDKDIYRMLNPYGLNVFPYTAAEEVVVDPCYVLIDATSPSAVFIAHQTIGIDWSYGLMYMGSVKGNIVGGDSYNLGKIDENTIYFGDIYLHIPGYNPFVSSDTKLVLPQED